ncbi:MAG: M17 family peptidase N-terminal domain-containing protein, partial [Bacilli bacterium]|nr:M17 family peptidase N-terminal domain-containing protein [Bacilli bacterium]
MLDINICLQQNDSDKPLVLGLFINQKVEIDDKINDDIEELIKSKLIKLELGETNKITTFSKIKNKVIYLIGLGAKEEYTKEKLK